MTGQRGDNGQSAGPLQFYEGGQLANFARDHGLSLSAAKDFVEKNPQAAIDWAIGTPDHPGYLGGAILAGQQKGLTGADLATYTQQHGQVSVSPERAGANYNAMFGPNGHAPDLTSASTTSASVDNTPVTPVTADQMHADFTRQLDALFGGANDAVTNAASGVAGVVGNTADELHQSFTDQLNKLTSSVSQATTTASNAIANAGLPDLGQRVTDQANTPGFTSSPIMQQANTGRANPHDAVNQASEGLANVLAPDTPIVTGALAGALNPEFLPGGAITAPLQLGGDIAAPIVKAAAGPLIGVARDALGNVIDSNAAKAVGSFLANESGELRLPIGDTPVTGSGSHDLLQQALDSVKAKVGPDDPTVRALEEQLNKLRPAESITESATEPVTGAVAEPIAQTISAMPIASTADAPVANGTVADAMRVSQSAADAMREAAQQNPMNKLERVLAVTRGNLLTAPTTMGLQVTGGVMETLGRPVRTLVSGEGKAALADVSAMGNGLTAAFANAGDALKYGYRRTRAELGGQQRTEAFQGAKGLLFTPGLRTMSAIDEFVQTLNAHGAMAMAASVESRATGRSMADLLANPTPWMAQTVRKAVETATYEGGESPIAKAITSTKQRWLKGDSKHQVYGAVLDVIVPFVSIPDAVIGRGLQMLSDAGGVRTGVDVVRMGKGLTKDTQGLTEAQRGFMKKQRMSEGMLANASLGMIGTWAINGTITGEGPSTWSPEYKRQLQETRGADGQPV